VYFSIYVVVVVVVWFSFCVTGLSCVAYVHLPKGSGFLVTTTADPTADNWCWVGNCFFCFGSILLSRRIRVLFDITNYIEKTAYSLSNVV